MEQLTVRDCDHLVRHTAACFRRAYPAEILAAAANLDGAQLDYEALIGEVGLRLLRRVNRGETLTPERVTTEMLSVFDAALPDKETPVTTTSVTYPNIACHICGRLDGVHKLDCPA